MTVSISWASVEQAIYNWLVPAVVPAAIFENQKQEAPAFPYASIVMTGSSREGGRDDFSNAEDDTRAMNITVTPAVADNTLYTITIGTSYSYTSGVGATASQITAGLASAMSGSGLTIVDNHGTLAISSSSLFHITTTTNLTWINNDNGHEIYSTTNGLRRLVYSVKFHDSADPAAPGGATVRAEAARALLSSQSIVDSFLIQGLAMVREQGVRDISAVINGQWVQRAALDVVFRTLVSVVDDTGYVSKVVATGTVKDESGTQTVVMQFGQ